MRGRRGAGGGGYAINLGGEFRTLEVHGEDCVTVYRALMDLEDFSG